MSSVRTRLIGILFFIANCFLLATKKFLLSVLTLLSFVPLFLFSVSLRMSSGASTPSGSNGLRYVLFALNVYLHDYNDYLHSERFNVKLSNDDEETVYDTCNGLDRDTALGARVCH